jgi:hypothetical protein
MRRFTPFTYVIFVLIAVGILDRLLAGPSGMIIPLLVFGIIFLLWKYPPNLIARKTTQTWSQYRRTGSQGAGKGARTTKSGRFRVIRGFKEADKDEEPPKYH